MTRPKTLRPSLRQALVVLGLLGSLTLALWLPPFCGPDEVFHWYRAVQVSSGHILSHKQDGQLGDRLPVWAEGLYAAIPASGLRPDERITAAAWQQAQAVPYATAKKFVAFGATAMYPPTFYVPQALAIKVGRLLHAQPLTLFYCARVTNALVAWLAVALALAWAEELALFWGVLLLLPVVLQQLGTLSPDAGMIACTLWLTCCVRRAATAAASEPKLWLGATVAIGLLAQARPPLLALVALLWMPALARHAPYGLWRTRLVCSAVACVLAFPWFVGCLLYGVSLRPDLPSVHERAQVLVHDPLNFVALLWRTTCRHIDGYLWMLVGSLGWLNAPISPEAFAASKVALGCGLLSGLRRPYVLSALDTACLWAAIMGSYCAMQGIFFLTWTSVDAPVIEGFQGRYAMMFLPLVALALPRLPWPRALHWALHAVGLAAAVRTLAAVPWAILARYYL